MTSTSNPDNTLNWNHYLVPLGDRSREAKINPRYASNANSFFQGIIILRKYATDEYCVTAKLDMFTVTTDAKRRMKKSDRVTLEMLGWHRINHRMKPFSFRGYSYYGPAWVFETWWT